MRTFIIKSGDEKTYKELGQYLRSLKPGDDYCIVVKKNRPVRSLSANAYYHVILSLIGIHTGHTHEQLHDICKKKFNYEVINLPKSGSEIRGKSTTSLDTAEFAAYVNRVKQWSLDEFNLLIPDARDLDYQKQIEIENQYDRVQSGF
jgi:ribosomal protein L30E